MTVKRGMASGLSLVLLAACGSGPEVATPATVAPGGTLTVGLDDRPFQLHVPQSSDPAGSAPLVVLLHGYTSSSAELDDYFQFTAESDRRGFLLAMPDGTTDEEGEQFWSAGGTCCDFYGAGVDDATYLRRVIDTVTSSYPVDPARVYLVGHSNGGFMAHRMACEHAAAVTAIASLAGVATDDASQCAPEHPVSVLQVHGTADEVIAFEGGELAGRPFPSAAATIEMWRDLNGCADRADTSAAPLDLESVLPGRETTVTTYAADCRDATRVELWSIDGGRHVPALTAEFAPAILDFLYAQPSRS
jgi:polyhydroxybutyrate depolymerase